MRDETIARIIKDALLDIEIQETATGNHYLALVTQRWHASLNVNGETLHVYDDRRPGTSTRQELKLLLSQLVTDFVDKWIGVIVEEDIE